MWNFQSPHYWDLLSWSAPDMGEILPPLAICGSFHRHMAVPHSWARPSSLPWAGHTALPGPGPTPGAQEALTHPSLLQTQVLWLIPL